MERIDPIKLCCFYPSSYHNGAQCPDGLTMCCLCFDRWPVDKLATDEDGSKVDVCIACRRAEDAVQQRRGRS